MSFDRPNRAQFPELKQWYQWIPKDVLFLQQVRAHQLAGTAEMLRPIFPKMMLGLILSIAVCLIGLGSNSADFILVANTASPLFLFLFGLWAAARIVRRHPITIWTPLPWIFFETGVFFGFGALIYTWGNAATRYKLDNGLFRLDGDELLRTNLVNSLGFTSFLVMLYFTSKTLSSPPQSLFGNRATNVPISLTILFFLLVGALIKTVLMFPALYSSDPSVVLPGSLHSAATLFELGLAGLAYQSTKRKWLAFVPLWILLPLNVFVASLQFSKRAILLPLILSAIGAYLGHRNSKKLIAWLVFCAILYFFLQPFIQFGRAYIASVPGGTPAATLSDRFEAFKAYFHEHELSKESQEKAELQEGWIRLAYNGPEGYAMRLYDNGKPGDSLKNAWAIPIPRFLWEEKPDLNPGRQYYYLVTGRMGTYVGITIYGDGYWQFGWLGVVVFGATAGFLFAWLNRHSLQLIRTFEFINFPLLLFGIQMSMLGPTKFFVNAVLGPIPIYFGYVLLVSIVRVHLQAAPPMRATEMR